MFVLVCMQHLIYRYSLTFFTTDIKRAHDRATLLQASKQASKHITFTLPTLPTTIGTCSSGGHQNVRTTIEYTTATPDHNQPWQARYSVLSNSALRSGIQVIDSRLRGYLPHGCFLPLELLLYVLIHPYLSISSHINHNIDITRWREKPIGSIC